MMAGPVVATRQHLPQNDEFNDNDLYNNYENINNNNIITDAVTRIATAQAGKRLTTGNVRLGTSNAIQPPTTGSSGNSAHSNRPMTAVKPAGYNSNVNTLNNTIGMNNSIPPLIKLSDTVNGTTNQLEQNVHNLLEQSALSANTQNYVSALDQAKKAGLAERALVKHRDKHSQEQNIDLTYSVLLNLGIQYTNNATAYNDTTLYDDALNVYQTMLNKKQFPVARVRVNMGHIYYIQKKYVLAIKCYRIAIDTLQGNTLLRKQLMRNIGNSFIRLRQYNDAVHSYETITDDVISAYNLCLCYYMLSDVEKLKLQYIALIQCTEYKSIARDIATGLIENSKNLDDTVIQQDDALQTNRLQKQKQLYHYIYVISKLIAPLIVKSGNLDDGYNWCIEQLYGVDSKQKSIVEKLESKESEETERPIFSRVAQELQISKGIQYLRNNEIQQAVTVFKSIDKSTDTLVYAHAAINLCYIAQLNNEYTQALQYADTACKYDRYNANALVNKANCLSHSTQYDEARELYLESIGVESHCYNAIYNLGLCNKRSGLYEDALRAFKKLYRSNSEDIYVVYEIGSIYELMQQYDQSIEWFNILHNTVINDCMLLAKLGSLHDKLSRMTGNTVHMQHAYHYYIESYQLNHTNIDVISWLGVYSVIQKSYDDAIQYFHTAATIETYEPKWLLMIASCYRRIDQLDDAIALYTKVLNTEYSDDQKNEQKNIECLKYLIAIYTELNDIQNVELYQSMLSKYSDTISQHEQHAEPSQPQSYSRPMSALRSVQPGQMQPVQSQANIYDARQDLHHRTVSQTVNAGLGQADVDSEWNTLNSDELLV